METPGYEPFTSTSPIHLDEARALAEQAYVFGLPLVYLDLDAQVMTNVRTADDLRAPINQFAHQRGFPAANRHGMGLDADTLTSVARVDVGAGPMVLSVPPMGDRYWLVQILDAWNEIPHAPGSRTVGARGGDFALVGPAWRGILPEGIVPLRVGTTLLHLGGRIHVGTRADLGTVHALQDRFRLTPLAAWGAPHVAGATAGATIDDETPVRLAVDAMTPVAEQVLRLPPMTFFQRLNRLMLANPPRPRDTPLLERIARIGVRPGDDVDFDAMPSPLRSAILDGVAAAQAAIHEERARLGRTVNGWNIALDLGRYGSRYTYRAAALMGAAGASLAEDVIHPTTMVDSLGRPLHGDHEYRLHFVRAVLPPVDGFWSVTVCDEQGGCVENALERYALGSRGDLLFNDDQSLTFRIGSAPPTPTRPVNWLPAPAGRRFKLVMRLYTPGARAIGGAWAPPPVQRV